MVNDNHGIQFNWEMATYKEKRITDENVQPGDGVRIFVPIDFVALRDLKGNIILHPISKPYQIDSSISTFDGEFLFNSAIELAKQGVFEKVKQWFQKLFKK